jgi:ferric-dicitrate binding protein FerR (iron transport regulator)
MNITKDIIADLFPLYFEKECSPDTRALVEEYFQRNPQDMQEFHRIASTSLRGDAPPAKHLDETRSLREARRVVRRRSWVLGFAIFFSLAPFSVLHTGERTYWLLREAPGTALIYGAFALACWIAWTVMHHRSRSL